jgi:pyrroloquinoline quinone (PQQ) biosynthesis protein C
MSMAELGADTQAVTDFINQVNKQGLEALNSTNIPAPAREFMQSTFGFIATGKPHVIASVFAFGREDVIPDMFTRMCNQLDYSALQYPRFRYYLDRHIEVDGDDHGPAAIAMIEELCDNDPIKIIEAEQAGIAAITARIRFWDNIERAILE